MEKLEGYEDIIKECEKIKDTEGSGKLSWLQWMVLLVLKFLANGMAPSTIPRNFLVHTGHFAIRKAPKGGVPSEDYCRKCRDLADRFNETILLARKKWETMHTDGLEGKGDDMLGDVLGESALGSATYQN